jgi:hypothetical protein
MKLSKKKFPFLYEKDVKWYFAEDYQGENKPFTREELNDALQDYSLIRDYFFIEIIEKHWSLFEKVHLFEIMQHWKHFQKDNYLIVSNDGISILIGFDNEKSMFIFTVLKGLAVAGMFYVEVDKDTQFSVGLTEVYFSNMLSKEQIDDLKDMVLQNFIISYAIRHFAPTEIKIVHDKNRRVRMGKGTLNKVTADSGLIVPVNIIDSSYLTTIIHVDATSVRGHFRLQPCGKLNLDRKLIWIDHYEKGPYKRVAKKLDD